MVIFSDLIKFVREVAHYAETAIRKTSRIEGLLNRSSRARTEVVVTHPPPRHETDAAKRASYVS